MCVWCALAARMLRLVEKFYLTGIETKTSANNFANKVMRIKCSSDNFLRVEKMIWRAEGRAASYLMPASGELHLFYLK